MSFVLQALDESDVEISDFTGANFSLQFLCPKAIACSGRDKRLIAQSLRHFLRSEKHVLYSFKY